jgi:CheY-like chemotaxis protein
MTEPKTSVNRAIRELYEIPVSRHAGPLPILQLAPELDQLSFNSKQIEVVFHALLETLPLFRETQPLILQSGVVGAPTLRRFGSSTDGRVLTISMGSKVLPLGCIDHTPGSEFTDLPALKHLRKIINEFGGTLLLTDIGGTLRRLRCILPMPNQEHSEEKRGREKILLVEDEEFVRNVTREVLELSGYTVLEAIDAESGIRIFQEHAASIDLLLTDVVMPGMNGRDLATKLFEISPALKAIFMSGYTENAITRQGFADPRLVYLQKPFTLDVLTRKVREVLDLPARVEPVPNYARTAAQDLAHTQF